MLQRTCRYDVGAISAWDLIGQRACRYAVGVISAWHLIIGDSQGDGMYCTYQQERSQQHDAQLDDEKFVGTFVSVLKYLGPEDKQQLLSFSNFHIIDMSAYRETTREACDNCHTKKLKCERIEGTNICRKCNQGGITCNYSPRTSSGPRKRRTKSKSSKEEELRKRRSSDIQYKEYGMDSSTSGRTGESDPSK